MKPRPAAWLPVPYEARDVEAIQAVARGEADPAQQAQALRWIIEVAAETYGVAYRSDKDGGERETSFALGRTFVGQQIVKVMKLSPAVIAQLRKKNGR